MATNNMRWQAPGNGKIFDDKLGSDSYMNKRTICVLTYIQKNPKVLQKNFELEIKDYLISCANYDKNDSLASHFFRPLLFMGFIQQYDNSTLELTIEGVKFLNAYKEKDFNKCKLYILNQLDNTKYPNKATKDIKLQLFPFRILFKLLLENNDKGIDSSFIKEQLVNITKMDNLDLYIQDKNLENIQKYESYEKFNTWVINSLVNIEILKKVSNKYFISDSLVENIKILYKDLEFKDFFFTDDILSCEINNKTAKQRYKRNAKFISEAKNRDKFICQVNNKHITFISNEKNYIEGHHIIPMFQQKNYEFNLDDVDNIISLCPNCHREIHSADNKNKIIDTLYSLNQEYMKSNNITLNDLYKMYMCA
jgi:5-methylcytosine-specific restriction protein A